MRIDLTSFIFGIVIAIAAIIVFEKVYGKLFGNKRQRELLKENRRLSGIVRKKDELIRQSLKSIEEMEKMNDGSNKPIKK